MSKHALRTTLLGVGAAFSLCASAMTARAENVQAPAPAASEADLSSSIAFVQAQTPGSMKAAMKAKPVAGSTQMVAWTGPAVVNESTITGAGNLAIAHRTVKGANGLTTPTFAQDTSAPVTGARDNGLQQVGLNPPLRMPPQFALVQPQTAQAAGAVTAESMAKDAVDVVSTGTAQPVSQQTVQASAPVVETQHKKHWYNPLSWFGGNKPTKMTKSQGVKINVVDNVQTSQTVTSKDLLPVGLSNTASANVQATTDGQTANANAQKPVKPVVQKVAANDDQDYTNTVSTIDPNGIGPIAPGTKTKGVVIGQVGINSGDNVTQANAAGFYMAGSHVTKGGTIINGRLAGRTDTLTSDVASMAGTANVDTKTTNAHNGFLGEVQISKPFGKNDKFRATIDARALVTKSTIDGNATNSFGPQQKTIAGDRTDTHFNVTGAVDYNFTPGVYAGGRVGCEKSTVNTSVVETYKAPGVTQTRTTAGSADGTNCTIGLEGGVHGVSADKKVYGSLTGYVDRTVGGNNNASAKGETYYGATVNAAYRFDNNNIASLSVQTGKTYDQYTDVDANYNTKHWTLGGRYNQIGKNKAYGPYVGYKFAPHTAIELEGQELKGPDYPTKGKGVFVRLKHQF